MRTNKQWVGSNEVRQAVTRCLRGLGVKGDELEELRQEVFVCLLESNEDPPTMERREALAVVIARRRFVDDLRKNGCRREKSEDPFGLDERTQVFDLPRRGCDPTDTLVLRDRLRTLVCDGTLGERELGMLVAKAEGFSDEEVGVRFGCTKRTVANVCSLARRTFRES